MVLSQSKKQRLLTCGHYVVYMYENCGWVHIHYILAYVFTIIVFQEVRYR